MATSGKGTMLPESDKREPKGSEEGERDLASSLQLEVKGASASCRFPMDIGYPALLVKISNRFIYG
jgi:hypothetical protein